MAGNSIGTFFTVTTFGESHGPAIGVIIDGTPPGLELDTGFIQRELRRRRPGQSTVSTSRNEADTAEILSGVFEGKTTGTPVAILIRNKDAAPEAYSDLQDVFRPGHGDYTYDKKYGIRDYRGGGRSSGRETAARVAAGAVAKLLLRQAGIEVRAYTTEAAGVRCTLRDLSAVEQNAMRACDPEAAARMEEKILKLASKGDSAGGLIECRAAGLPPGLGEPVFSKLDAEIAKAVLSIGGIKGIEFGGGFACAAETGSTWNDEMDGSGFLSNNSGGILSGISTGQELVFRAAVKPTPSIGVRQSAADTRGEQRNIEITGRHDPCLCPRIVPVVEAMTALVLADMMLIRRAAIVIV